MKRLLFLMGMFLTFASFGYAETKIDTIWFDIKPDTVGEDVTTGVQYYFAEEIEDYIEWEWVSAKGKEDGVLDFMRKEEVKEEISGGADEGGENEDGEGKTEKVVKVYTVHRQMIKDTGRMYIYYTPEDESATFTAYFSARNTRSLFDIKTVTESKRIITALDASDCATLDTLDCHSNLLESLNISGCTALKVLDCSQNLLKSVDISGCAALESFQCDRNQFESLEVNGNTALTKLSCYDNQLATLDVSKLVSLRVLQCDFNNLTSLDVSGNPSLEDLDCASNRLTALDVNNHVVLKNLSCDKNNLISLNVSGCSVLQDLNCSNNELISLDVSGCSSLKNVYCWGNELRVLNAQDLKSLSRLHCYKNQLTQLDVSNNTNLNELDCSSNQLTSLSASNCPALRSLNCNNNQLQSLDVSGCTSLPSLFCNNNRLTNLNVSGCISLSTLNCNNNQLTTLNLSGLDSLSVLMCYNNQLNNLDVRACTALVRLYCYNNQLTSLNASGCDRLRELSCDSNQLKILDINGCTSLPSLSCMNNQLTSLNIKDCPFLRILHCENNQLTELNINDCPALTEVYCGNNRLNKLDISRNTVLWGLNCENNQLDSLDISQNTALRSLYCSNNRMPLSVLSKIYGQHSGAWFEFVASGQTGSCTLPIVQSLDLSSERILGDSLSVYRLTDISGQAISSNDYTEDNFNFRFHKIQAYSLEMENPSMRTICRDTDMNGTLITFTWHILAEMPEGYFSVQVASNNNDWGTAAIAGDSVVVGNDRYYQAGTSVTIRATVKEDYLFVNWTDKDGQVFSTEAEYTFEVTEDLELTANFRKNEFTVRVSTSNSAWGVVSMIGSGTYAYGEEATIIATPRDGYRFVDWKKDDGEVFSTEAEYPFKVTEDLHLTAYFKKREIVTVELSVNNPEWGSVSQSGSGTYEEDDEVTITATPIEGYHFVNWTKGGAVFSTESKHTFTVTEDLELTAVFAQDAANEDRQDDSFYVYAQDRNIILSENRGQVKVFNAAGQCVYSGNATLIPVRRSGLYLVRVGISSYKVIVR